MWNSEGVEELKKTSRAEEERGVRSGDEARKGILIKSLFREAVAYLADRSENTIPGIAEEGRKLSKTQEGK